MSCAIDSLHVFGTFFGRKKLWALYLKKTNCDIAHLEAASGIELIVQSIQDINLGINFTILSAP